MLALLSLEVLLGVLVVVLLLVAMYSVPMYLVAVYIHNVDPESIVMARHNCNSLKSYFLSKNIVLKKN